MHMSDALISPTAAAVTGVVAAGLLATCLRRIRTDFDDGSAQAPSEYVIPLMGVMGAFVFAAQMLNFAIPGTGSSGHIVGGILLCAMLGTRAAFVTLSSVIMLQCLLFADGGLLALGCNIINMAAMSCLVAYPAVYRPIAGDGASAGRIFAASILSSVVALELGAVAVVVETSLSGITQLPPARFLAFMLPIHLLIGLGEGIATGSVLCAVRRYGMQVSSSGRPRGSIVAALVALAAAALMIGGVASWVASSDPDGLEWSIGNTAASEPIAAGRAHDVAESIRQTTAAMPDYDHSLAGVVGCVAVMAVVLIGSYLLRPRRKRT